MLTINIRHMEDNDNTANEKTSSPTGRLGEAIGLFTGTFDPFTIGHADIVSRALPLFDRLVIGVGVNPEKKSMLTAKVRVDAIRNLYAHEEKIEVLEYDDFAVDLAKRVGARYIVKGVRSIKDFEYEQIQADFNKRLGGMETLLLYANPQYVSISSTAVRTLMKFGKDASWMLPKGYEI